jgi:hypothetical protein
MPPCFRNNITFLEVLQDSIIYPVKSSFEDENNDTDREKPK